MATAGTTLARAAFANQAGSRVNLKLLSTTGVAIGDPMTVTVNSGLSAGTVVTGVVRKFVGSTGIKLAVTLVNKPSGVLLLPKGSAVA